MRWKLSLAATVLGLVAASVTTAALAFDFGVANAVSSGNLSVYLVRGADAATAPLTLEQGLAGGQFKVYETERRPIEVENLSSRSVFIQAGSMLVGGLQDQVVVSDTVIGPHSGRVPVETLCVDPFRSTARSGESAKVFANTGGLFPSRLAALALLAQPASEKVVRKLRQSAVWWSIDSVRGELSQRLGHMPETPRKMVWDERETDDVWARAFQQNTRSHWKTSLPLALEDAGLARAARPYHEALLAAGQRAGVIGAVFAINGRVEGAEIYQSNGLFRAMWPSLLRAYAVRALVAAPDEQAARPSVADVTAFLDAADAGQPRADVAQDAIGVRESAGAIATVTAADGKWIHRSYVAKLADADAARSPAAALVAALDRGVIEGQPVTSLDPGEPIVPKIDTLRDPTLSARDVSWRVALPDSRRMLIQALAAAVRPTALDHETAARIERIATIMSVAVAALVAMLLLWLANPLPKMAAGAQRLVDVVRRQCTAGWGRSAVARSRRVDRTAAMLAGAAAAMPAEAAAGMQVDAIVSLALRRSVLRLADRRRLRHNRPRDLVLRTPVGGRATSDLAA
jgi:hypothetical protein